MNLIDCHSCKKEVSKKALKCPHCGQQLKAPEGINLKDPVLHIGIIIMIIIIMIIVFVVSGIIAIF